MGAGGDYGKSKQNGDAVFQGNRQAAKGTEENNKEGMKDRISSR